MGKDVNAKAIDFADQHPLLSRAAGGLSVVFCSILPALVLPSTGLGVVSGTLVAAFAGAVGAGGFSLAAEYDRLAAASRTQKQFKIDTDTELKPSKGYVAVMALFGSVVSGTVGGAILSDWEELKMLPAIDPHTVVETKSVELHTLNCTGDDAGTKIRVTHDGRNYSIICPQ